MIDWRRLLPRGRDRVMSGPAGKTYGPRNSNGYQFPRTHSVSLSRGEPIRRERVPGGHVEIVPLVGSARGKLFDVCSSVTRGDPPVTSTSTFIAHDQLEAAREFGDLMRQLAGP